MNQAKNIPIGEVLKEYGYITEDQLKEALAYQKQNRGKRLGTVLMDQGYVTETQVLEALSRRLNHRVVDLSNMNLDPATVAKIPQQIAEKYDILALDEKENHLVVATNDPLNFYALEDVRQLTGMDLEITLAEKAPLERAIAYYYSEVSAHKAASIANESFQDTEMEELELEEGDGDVPIIKLLNSLVQRAYSTKASDIHIEPFEDKSLVRMRIDGTIVDYVTLRKGVHTSLIARIKIIAGMDIAERRMPQDGHGKMKIDGIPINIRVSVIPTVYGEKAVLRLLVRRAVISNNSTFGMEPADFDKFSRMLRSPNGVIYITGPTGSGKTTTLYMVLEELAKKQVNISTIEDPVEKNIAKVNQMQVNTQAGLTFEVGLRALLRQDPDIIMVGETRDSETASISVRAAITGHLVMSTLHTNSAASSIVRLIDMGLEPYLLANSLVGIVAQRLMRRVCPYCAQEVDPTDSDRELLGSGFVKIKKPVGCGRCNHTGYSGRVAIHEILMIDAPIRKMISAGATVDEIQQYAIDHQGMRTLRDLGADVVKKGISTVDELQKVAFYS